jgi:hypothetical protein
MVTGKAALPSGSRQQPEREKRRDAGDDLHKVEARAWSRSPRMKRDIYPAKGPGGRGTKAGRSSAHRSGAQRAAPPQRGGGWWWCPRVVLGDGGARRVRSRRGEKCTGKTACCFSARKRLARTRVPPYLWASVYKPYTANTGTCVCPSPAYSNSDGQPGRPRKGRE